MRRRLGWRSAAGALAAGLLLLGAVVVGRGNNPGQWGRVRWFRDPDLARDESRRSGRPLMVLSVGKADSEARGRFAAGALSHPIVVDAAGEFVAVATTKVGAGEPSVRFTGADGKDLVAPDAASDPARHSTARLLARMVEALRAAGRPVPPYLELVAAEYNPPPSKETASFVVGCYWKGEKELGRLDGVLATRTGMVGREEVVEVEFDPGVLSFRDLSEHAVGMKCFQKVNARSREQGEAAADVVKATGGDPAAQVVRTDAPADTSDPNNQQQYFLSLHPTYHFLPLTSLQATKVNAALSGKEGVERFLSPTQLALQRRMAKLVEKERRALYGIEQSLKPDRSPEGLARYAAEIERRVRGME